MVEQMKLTKVINYSGLKKILDYIEMIFTKV